MMTTAKDLVRGDVLSMKICCEVLATEVVVGGRRIKIRMSLENSPSTEFTDTGHVAEFLCKPSRSFYVYRDCGDGDTNEPIFDPTPDPNLVLVD